MCTRDCDMFVLTNVEVEVEVGFATSLICLLLTCVTWNVTGTFDNSLYLQILLSDAYLNISSMKIVCILAMSSYIITPFIIRIWACLEIKESVKLEVTQSGENIFIPSTSTTVSRNWHFRILRRVQSVSHVKYCQISD